MTFNRRKFIQTAGIGAAIAGAVPAAMAQSESGNATFAGKTAFITGGARGIGRACAEELAKEGANIVLYDVAGQIETVKYPLATRKDLADAKSAVEALGVRCLAVQGDVRDRADLESAMAEAVSTFGRLDFIVANAGITQIGALDQFTDEEGQTVLDVNLGGVIKTVQAALPILREQKSGRLVLVSSVTGRAGSDRFPIYCSTKWGVIGLAKSVALMMGPHNVTCNAVCPTLVHTKLLDNEYILGTISPDNPSIEVFNAYAAQTIHPMGVGLYEPARVGQAVKFLCGPDADLISGEVLDIGAAANARFNA